MKICMITPEYFPVPSVKGGAVETLVTFLLEENSEKRKCSITMVTVASKEAEKVSRRIKGTEFIFIPYRKGIIGKVFRKIYLKLHQKLWKKNASSILYQKKIVKALKRKEFDFIIIEGGDLEAYGYLRKKLKYQKFIAHSHGDWPGSITLRDLYQHHIVISQYAKDRLVCNQIIKEKDVTILENCVSEVFFHNTINEKRKLEIKASYGIKPDEIVIVFCGRINEDKGVKELIEAFLQMEFKDKCKLLIVGKANFGSETNLTPFEEKIRVLSKKAGEQIIFTGFLHNTKLPEIHAISDIATVPSIWNEPSGMVVIEAMASGLPIIATNSGGIPELLTKDCGVLLERDEHLVKNLANHLDSFVMSKKLRMQIGEEGKKRAQDYRKSKYYENFLKTIEVINVK